MCRSRRELSNEYLLAKIGVDTAENEHLEVSFNIIQYYSFASLGRGRGAAGRVLLPGPAGAPRRAAWRRAAADLDCLRRAPSYISAQDIALRKCIFFEIDFAKIAISSIFLCKIWRTLSFFPSGGLGYV